MKCRLKYILAALSVCLATDSIQAIEKTDFRVNDDVGTTQQNHPRIAVAADQTFVVTWIDYRNGNSDIILQRFDANANPLNGNVIVNDDVTGAYQFVSAIAVDWTGAYSIVWKDYRNYGYPFNPDIFFQRTDSALFGANPNINVTVEPPDSSRETPDIDLYQDGRGIVVWGDYRNKNWDIYGQIISANGSPLGANFKVNDDLEGAQQHAPRVTISDDGWFVIAWYDNRRGDDDIYIQLFDSTGNPRGENTLVTDDDLEIKQAFPDIAADASGHFTVVWIDWRNGHYPANPDIYARKYDTSMVAITEAYQVNDDLAKTAQREATIAADRMGNVAIIWADSSSSSWDITGQMVDVDGIVRERNFQANSFADSLQLHPDVALDGRYRYITWADKRSGNFDVYASITKYNDPALIIAPTSLSFTMEYAGVLPATRTVTVDHAGYNPLNFAVRENSAWLTVTPSTGRTPTSIEVGIDPSGLIPGTYTAAVTVVDIAHADSSLILPVRLDITTPILSVLPDTIFFSAFGGVDDDLTGYISILNKGSGQFNWTASQNSNWLRLEVSSGVSPDTIMLYANAATLGPGQYTTPIEFTADGIPGSPDTVWVQINCLIDQPYLQVRPDSFYIRTEVGGLTDTTVFVDNSGIGSLSWSGYETAPWLSLVPTFGAADQTVALHIDYTGLLPGVYQTSVNFVDSGSFNVVKSVPFILDIFELSADTIIFEPSNIGLSESGVMPIRLILNTEATQLYLPIEFDPTLITVDSVSGGQISTGNQLTVITTDEKKGRVTIDFTASATDPSLPVGDYILADLHFTGKTSDGMVMIDAAQYDTVSVYIRAGTGRKLTPIVVPGEITVGNPTSARGADTPILPSRFDLAQNYPNPFNMETIIEFDLPFRTGVELIVFNVLGQEIRTLHSGDLPAGRHVLGWDGTTLKGRSVASGIYFYRLKTSSASLVRKMLLIK